MVGHYNLLLCCNIYCVGLKYVGSLVMATTETHATVCDLKPQQGYKFEVCVHVWFTKHA